VRSAVFEQIRSERQRVAAATRAEGESQARIIRSAADRDRAAVIAQAEADAARLIGEGEAQAARIANEAHAADPAFYQFLKTLETYRAALDARTTLVLSAESRFLRLLIQGVPDTTGERPPGSGSPVAARGSAPSLPSPGVLGSESSSPGAPSPPAEGQKP
jgi:modulator of FtsH protease HflC